MNKWILIRLQSIVVFIVTIIWIIMDIIQCMSQKYPHDSLGVTMFNWFDQFTLNLAFYGIIWTILLIGSIVLFIISIKKIKKESVK